MLHVNSGYKTNPSLIFSIFSRPMVPLKLESQAFSNLNFSFWGPLSRPSSSHLTAPALRHPLLTPSDSLLTVNSNNSFIFFIFYFSFPLVSHSWGWERLLLFFYTFTHTITHLIGHISVFSGCTIIHQSTELFVFTIYSALVNTFIYNTSFGMLVLHKLWKYYLLLTDKSNSTTLASFFSEFPRCLILLWYPFVSLL